MLVCALLAVGVVWMVTRLRPDAQASTLLLAGVSLNFFFSSLILFLGYSPADGAHARRKPPR